MRLRKQLKKKKINIIKQISEDENIQKLCKECTCISDEHALRGLLMLLEEEAAVWYRGIKSSVTSWEDALHKLRGMFGVPRPPHKLFRDIFAAEQTDERTEIFVGRLRALISKLPYRIENAMEVDIIYGLLHRRIRKRVTRESVDNLESLIEKARNIEDSLSEMSDARETARHWRARVSNAAAASASMSACAAARYQGQRDECNGE
ncbi:unnamed protein product [Euphydryas editha]|uniref:Retrotransposon gag domain-containing protein n=1 Tax=Euphydryas editha TaxID=104508 RepID=A0AAU9TGJ0_EUPED|nr:unnamed protein product [Euphydryas editha]